MLTMRVLFRRTPRAEPDTRARCVPAHGYAALFLVRRYHNDKNPGSPGTRYRPTKSASGGVETFLCSLPPRPVSSTYTGIALTGFVSIQFRGGFVQIFVVARATVPVEK